MAASCSSSVMVEHSPVVPQMMMASVSYTHLDVYKRQSVGLLNPAHHLGILDDYAQNRTVFQEYYALYRELVRVKRCLLYTSRCV